MQPFYSFTLLTFTVFIPIVVLTLSPPSLPSIPELANTTTSLLYPYTINVTDIADIFNITNVTAIADIFNITNISNLTDTISSSSSSLLPLANKRKVICPLSFDRQTQARVPECVLALQDIPRPSLQPVDFTREDLPKPWEARRCRIEFGFEDPTILPLENGNGNGTTAAPVVAAATGTELLSRRASMMRRQRLGQDARDGEGPGEGGEADAPHEKEEDEGGDRISWLEVQLAAYQVVMGCGKYDAEYMVMRSAGMIGGLGKRGLLMVKVERIVRAKDDGDPVENSVD